MKQLHLRLVIFVALLLSCAALLLSYLALRHFERDLPPEMARTVAAVAYSTNAVLASANNQGIPFEEMVGVDEFLQSVRKENPDLSYMVITDGRKRILYQSGLQDLRADPALQQAITQDISAIHTARHGAWFHTAMPLVFRQHLVGYLHVGQKAALIEHKLQEVTYDVLTVLLVASLIAVEVLRFVLTFTIATPAQVMRDFLQKIRNGDFSNYLPHEQLAGVGQLSAHFNRIVARMNQRFQQLNTSAHHIRDSLAGFQFHSPGQHKVLSSAALDHIRWPFFLLIFADSLSLSFFPVFVGQFYSPDFGIPKSLVVGLPISMFMFTWALSMPWAGSWSDHVGHRRAFAVGASVTTCGLILTAFAQTLFDLLLWRSITAIGYGLVFITAQGYVTQNTPPAERTKGMAMFLSTFFAGSLSGSAIGGILADRLGYDKTILLSALLSAASAFFVLRFLRARKADTAARKKFCMADLKRLLRHPQFAAITFLAAVPAKIALTGFLYYSVPLYLKLLGNNQSTIGRVMMAYGLAIILFSPLIAKLADRVGHLRWFVSVGGFAASLAMFVICYFDNMFGLLLSVSLLGIAHAIGVSPQLALINDFCRDVVAEVGAGTASGIFRLIERIGNVLGPIIAALLIAHFGFQGAFLGIGVLSLTCISAFTLIFFYFGRERTLAAHS